MMETDARHFEIKDYIRIFTKRKWVIVLVTLAATMIGGLYAASYRPTYRATALILIRKQPIEHIQFAEQRPIESRDTSEEFTLETLARIAIAYHTAERTAAKLSARTSGKRIVTNASEIVKSTKAYPQKPDRLIIETTNEERNKAIGFTNETAETFVTISAELRNQDVLAAKEFLKKQLENVSATLDELELQLAEYQQQVGIVIPQTEAKATVEDLRSYRHALDEANTALQVSLASRQMLQTQLAQAQAKPIIEIQAKEPNPERALIQSQIRHERVNLVNLLAKYKEDHPQVAQTKRTIQSLEARCKHVPQFIEVINPRVNPRIEALQNQISSMDITIAQHQQRINRLDSIVARILGTSTDLPLQLAYISRLESKIALARSTYESFMAQLEQTKLREAIKEGSATIIDRAADAEEIRPRLGRMIIFGFALGLFCALMLALMLEALDDTFHSPDDITHYTDVPFLGMIPMMEERADELVTISAPKSPPAEAYRALRSNIHFAQLDSPARTYLVTSAGAGEGKSLTAANLAVVFAQSGQRVLLLDSDLRRPTLHRFLHIDADRGLTNVLIGESTLEEVIQQTQIPGLSIVCSGPLPPNPADMLNSDQMAEILRQATILFDTVLLDSPPAIVLTDAVLLASRVDQTILVAECDHVSRTAFTEMIRLIRHARGNILGTVLNKLKLTTSDYYYYYYYYYDYSREMPVPQITDAAADKTTADSADEQKHKDTPDDKTPPPNNNGSVLDDLLGLNNDS